MRKFLDITLGIMAALGGFLDIGEIVYATQAGARFAFATLWAILLGTVGIIIFCEMSGRIAAVAKKATFDVIREKLNRRLGLAILAGSCLVGLATCAAEIGGMVMALQVVSGWPFWITVLISLVFLLVLTWFSSFKWLEYTFGFLGLALIVFAAAAIAVHPDWSSVAKGLVPHVPHLSGTSELLVYAYFVVGIIGTVLMPYEIYFYSSGGIEDKWQVEDLPMNVATANVGFTIAGVVAAGIVVLGAQLYLPRGNAYPQLLTSALLTAAIPFGKWGLWLALFGVFISIAAAAVQTALATSYSVAQFFKLPWGKDRKVRRAKTFNLLWIGLFIGGAALVISGMRILNLVEYAVMFSLVILPFVYFPILQAARDKSLLGKHTNSPALNVVSWGFFRVLCVVALSAIALLLLTKGGLG